MRWMALSMAAIAALAAPARAQAPGAAPLAVPAEGTLLDIVAEGKAQRAPDLALVSAGVITPAPSAAAAMAAQAERMARVLAALDRAGVAAKDVRTTQITLAPQYRYPPNAAPEITGYQASNSVSVKLRDLPQAGAVLDALVKAGANDINGPSLTLADPEAALDEARADAMARARARAALYAKAAGLRIVRLVSISEAGPVLPPPMPIAFASARAEAKADTVIRPGETEVSVQLSLRYLLQ